MLIAVALRYFRWQGREVLVEARMEASPVQVDLTSEVST